MSREKSDLLRISDQFAIDGKALMALIIPYNPMATDFTLSEFANIRDIKYSFHTLIKLKIVTVMIPGCAIGSMIFQKKSQIYYGFQISLR